MSSQIRFTWDIINLILVICLIEAMGSKVVIKPCLVQYFLSTAGGGGGGEKVGRGETDRKN